MRFDHGTKIANTLERRERDRWSPHGAVPIFVHRKGGVLHMVKDDQDSQGPEANRLYWEERASVGDIANKLGVSRRALYDLIEPQSARKRCPKCRSIMVYVNRSAQSGHHAKCQSCGHEETLEAASNETKAPRATSRTPSRSSDDGLDRRVLMAGAAVAGIAVGAIIALMLTRSDD